MPRSRTNISVCLRAISSGVRRIYGDCANATDAPVSRKVNMSNLRLMVIVPIQKLCQKDGKHINRSGR